MWEICACARDDHNSDRNLLYHIFLRVVSQSNPIQNPIHSFLFRSDQIRSDQSGNWDNLKKNINNQNRSSLRHHQWKRENKRGCNSVNCTAPISDSILTHLPMLLCYYCYAKSLLPSWSSDQKESRHRHSHSAAPDWSDPSIHPSNGKKAGYI